jgi:tetratricopeptide (TPR) repeat protein
VNANYIDASAYLMVPQSIAHCRIRASLADGKIDEAIAQARASLAIMPGNIDLVIGMVNELDRRGRKGDSNAIYNGARDLYTKLATEHPGSAFAHNSVAWISANCRRDLDKALVHAKKAVELEPNGAGYIDTLAEVHFRLGDKEKAIEAMKKCLELSPNRVYFRKQLERFRAGDPNSEVPDEGDED